MADTYTSLFCHFVFGIKNRVGYIKPEIEQRLWEYIGGIARENPNYVVSPGRMAMERSQSVCQPCRMCNAIFRISASIIAR